MGKSFVIRNQRSLNGETTNAVLVTLKAWQNLWKHLRRSTTAIKIHI